MYCFVSLFLVVSTSAIVCLESLISKMTYHCVEWDTKLLSHSLVSHKLVKSGCCVKLLAAIVN